MSQLSKYLTTTASKKLLLVLLCVFGCLQVEVAWGQDGRNKILNGNFMEAIDGTDWNVNSPSNINWESNYLAEGWCIRGGGDESWDKGKSTLTSNEMTFCKNTKVIVFFNFTSKHSGRGNLHAYLGNRQICKIKFYEAKLEFEVHPQAGMEVYVNNIPVNFAKTYPNYSSGGWYDIKIVIPEYSQAPISSKLRFEVEDNSLSLRYAYIDNVEVREYDETKPTFTTPEDQTFCVNNITSANYNETTQGDVNNPPDYYEFPDGYTGFDITNIQDNCCLPENPISWTINGTAINKTGQPSENIGGTKLWLDVDTNNPKASYNEKDYTITYRVKDCQNNTTEIQKTITIKPRPKIDFVNN